MFHFYSFGRPPHIASISVHGTESSLKNPAAQALADQEIPSLL